MYTHDTRIPKSALRHRAKSAGITQHALRIACSRNMTITAKVQAIRDANHKRGGAVTLKTARQRLDAAVPVAKQLLDDLEMGRWRQHRAAVETPSLPERFAAQIAQRLRLHAPGGLYSGSTHWDFEHGSPDAWTDTSQGDTYSGRCTYHRTNATHKIRATLSGLKRIADAGLPYSLPRDDAVLLDVTTIRVEPEGRVIAATIADGKGKAIRCRQVFIADQGDEQYHVAKTERAAITALRRAATANAPFVGPRVSATDLQKKLGWCGAGIRSWCAAHGIRRALSQRLVAGTSPQAVIRLVEKHGGPKDEYDRRLLKYLGWTGTAAI